MSEFKRLKSELFEGGVAKLRAVIETHRSLIATPVEREFDAKWASELKARVTKGLAVSFSWAVADLPLSGKITRLRMNGNHSSWALAELLKEDALPSDLAIHLDTYSVSDRDAAVLLFRQFDCRKSARSKDDVAGAYQCFQEGIRDCKRSSAKIAIEGVNWANRRFREDLPILSGDDVYGLFNDDRLHPFIRMIDGILDSKCRELKRVAIMAAAYGTWLEDARRAEEFWKLVACGSQKGAAESAAADLDDELVSIATAKTKAKVSDADIYAMCAKAWVVYLDGGRVSSFKVNTKAKGLQPIAA